MSDFERTITTEALNSSPSDNTSDVTMKENGGNVAEYSTSKSPKSPKERNIPTHFIGLRVYSPNIWSHIDHIQKEMIKKKGFLRKALQKPCWCHMTLFVMSICNAIQLQHAKEVLLKSRLVVDKYYSDSSPIVHLNHLNAFGNRVLYIDCEENDELKRLKEFVKEYKSFFSNNEIEIKEEGDWTPHCTMFKFHSRRDQIYPSYYKSFKDYDFGSYSIKNIGLYKMEKKKTEEDHFYIEEESINFPTITEAEEISKYEETPPIPPPSSSSTTLPIDQLPDTTESEINVDPSVLEAINGEDKTITFDGNSFQNGGGQLLRTALSISCLYKIPFTFNNIRIYRKPKTGLLAQHLTGVNVMTKLFQADVIGNILGSLSLDFSPSSFNNELSEYRIPIGTAGSIMLIIQTILPSLLALQDHPIKFNIIGGTHVLASPFLECVEFGLKPYLNLMGINFKSELKKYGFFPKGGGEVEFTFEPVSLPLKQLVLTDPGKIVKIKGKVFLSSNISPASLETIQSTANDEIEDNYDDYESLESIEIESECINRKMYSCEGGGLYLLAYSSTGCVLTSQTLYDSNHRNANIGRQCVREFLEEIDNKVCLDSYIQDQVLIFMALAEGHSKILVGPITDHTKTCIDIIQQMINVKFKITSVSDKQNYIECDGIGYNRK